MKERVDNFIESIYKLRTVEGGLMLLKHHAQNNNSDDLDSLDQSYNIISSTNQKLISSINKCLVAKDVAAIKNFSSQMAEISKNISDVVEIINHVKSQNIPGKSEMVEILQFCSANFSVDQFINVFVAINGNESELRQQIIALGDVCENIL
ncbi:MAG: hypothetical protein V4612_02530 [Pseudomonadota bacterium]